MYLPKRVLSLSAKGIRTQGQYKLLYMYMILISGSVSDGTTDMLHTQPLLSAQSMTLPEGYEMNTWQEAMGGKGTSK